MPDRSYSADVSRSRRQVLIDLPDVRGIPRSGFRAARITAEGIVRSGENFCAEVDCLLELLNARFAGVCAAWAEAQAQVPQP
jgi:hypothetical protein